MTADRQPANLIDHLWPAVGANVWFRRVMLVVFGVLLIAASAKIRVPMWPVPMTLQTFAVLVVGMAYGARLGSATVLAYLALGAVGLPVFAGTPEKGIGLAYMAGPTGGYLLGFLVAATAVGALAERGWGQRITTTVLAMLIGNLLIYLPGLAWLGAIVGWDKPVLEWGLYPFLTGDAVKVALAAATMPLLWRSARGRRP